MTFACDLTAATLSGAAHHVRHAGKDFHGDRAAGASCAVSLHMSRRGAPGEYGQT